MARGRKGKSKPPAKEDMAAQVPKKLTDAEIEERGRRFQVKFGEKRALEKRKAKVTSEINGDLKEVNAELDKLHEEILHGVEMLAQGDLFAGEEGGNDVPQPVAQGALGELERRDQEKAAPTKPGNSHADDLEDPPRIDRAQADNVRRAARGEKPLHERRKSWKGRAGARPSA